MPTASRSTGRRASRPSPSSATGSPGWPAASARSGSSPGDRVLDLQTNQNTYVETDLAIPTAGLVRAALNHRLHPDDWARIADDCGARALIYDARFAEQTDALRSGLDADRVIVIGDGPGTPYEKLLANQSAAPLLLSCDPDSLAGLHYSSGTTGHPKGAQRTHRNRMASLVNMVTRRDRGAARGGRRVRPRRARSRTPAGCSCCPSSRRGQADRSCRPGTPRRSSTRSHTAAARTPHWSRPWSRDCSRCPASTPTASEDSRCSAMQARRCPLSRCRQAHEQLTNNLVQYYGLVEAIPPVTVLDAADHARGLADDPDLLASAGRPAFGVEVAHRRRVRPWRAGRRGRRGRDPRRPRHARLLERRAPETTCPRPFATAGCTPATSDAWTQPSASGSSTARAT